MRTQVFSRVLPQSQRKGEKRWREREGRGKGQRLLRASFISSGGIPAISNITVPNTVFHPKPSVTSSVTKLTRKDNLDEKKIFDLLINDESKISFISSRWAAKEAIYKALNNKDILFINIEILNDENGKPYCSNYNKIILSISHTKVHCIAVALLLK